MSGALTDLRSRSWTSSAEAPSSLFNLRRGAFWVRLVSSRTRRVRNVWGSLSRSHTRASSAEKSSTRRLKFRNSAHTLRHSSWVNLPSFKGRRALISFSGCHTGVVTIVPCHPGMERVVCPDFAQIFLNLKLFLGGLTYTPHQKS